MGRKLVIVETKYFMYSVFVFVPKDKRIIRKIIDAASKAGAGKNGKYSKCAFIAEGIGTWKAEIGAHPAYGKAGSVQYIEEVKIEMHCPEKSLKNVLAAIKKVHPYEEVVIDVIKLETVYEN